MNEPPADWDDLSPADAWPPPFRLALAASLAMAVLPFAWAEVRWGQWCDKHLKARRR